MRRGDLFRVYKPTRDDPKKHRVFVVVSRQTVIDSQISTVICAPVYSRYDGLSTQIAIGVDEGLKHECSIHCDELMSLTKTRLTNFVGRLSFQKLELLNESIRIALESN